MSHNDEHNNLIVGFLTGELDDEEMDDLESLLSVCPECVQSLHNYRVTQAEEGMPLLEFKPLEPNEKISDKHGSDVSVALSSDIDLQTWQPDEHIQDGYGPKQKPL